MQSISSMAGAAMRVYDEVIHEQIYQENILMNNILRNVAHTQGVASAASSSTIGGGGKFLTVHYGRNVGSAAGTEFMTLPTAGKQAYKQANIPMKYNVHQIAVTDVSLRASEGKKELLVSVLEAEYEGAKMDMARQITRQAYGIGTGEICKVNVDPTTGTTVDFDTPMIGKNPTDYIEAGNLLRFGGTAGTVATVDSITDGNTIEIDATVAAIADNDAVYIAQSATQSNKDNEMMGLKGMIDDGTNVATLEGLARSSNLFWKSSVASNSGTLRNLTDALLHTTWIASKKFGKTKYILTSPDVISTYGQTLTAVRRYANADMKLNGGFEGLDFNGIPMVSDIDCPYSEAFFVDPSVISIEDLAPISFLDRDGSKLYRSSTTPVWNATLTYYANFAISAPNKQATLRDVK